MDVVKKVEKDRIDEFFSFLKGEAVPLFSATVCDDVFSGFWGISRAAFAAEVFFRDLSMAAHLSLFPGVFFPSAVFRQREWIERFIMAPCDELPLGILPSDLFLF